MQFTDISPRFRWNPVDAGIAKKLVELENTPQQIEYFASVCHRLTDYAYWFFLSTCWVGYTGFSDLSLWKELFASDRPHRKSSIMKPSELEQYNYLPPFVKAYRAHRENETDWIAYTLDPVIAARFAVERGVVTVQEYQVKKRDIVGLFLRRGEKEIICLDHTKLVKLDSYSICVIPDDSKFRCDSRDENNRCTSREEHIKKYKDPCRSCCVGCAHAIEMSCKWMCIKAAEFYYPDETEE